MSKKKKVPSLTREETAALINEIAERVAKGDRSFDLQIPIVKAEQALAELRHLDGLKLLNRIGLLLITLNGKAKSRYELVQKTVEALPPFNPIEDSIALRSLADEIRKNTIAD